MRKREVTVPAYMYERDVRMKAQKEASMIAERDKARRRREIGTWVRLLTALIVSTWLFACADETTVSLIGMTGASASAVMLVTLIVIRMYPDQEEDDGEE